MRAVILGPPECHLARDQVNVRPLKLRGFLVTAASEQHEGAKILDSPPVFTVQKTGQ
jgi:hypothetical protein